MDAKWYRLARFDSAVVSMPDGTSAALYQRDPERVPRDGWPAPSRSTSGSPGSGRELAQRYRDALPRADLAGGLEARPSSGPSRADRDRRSSAQPRPGRAPRHVATAPSAWPTRRWRPPSSQRRPAGRLPAPLPAAAAGAQGDPGPLQRLVPGPVLVLRAAGDPLRDVLLRDRGHPPAAQERAESSGSTCSPGWSSSTTSPRPSRPAPGRSCATRRSCRRWRCRGRCSRSPRCWSRRSTSSRGW